MPGLWRNRGFRSALFAASISLAGSGVTTLAFALLVHPRLVPAQPTTILGQTLMLRLWHSCCSLNGPANARYLQNCLSRSQEAENVHH